MTKLSNVPMQPNPNAVEHLTLIEKLNDHKETITVLRGTEKQGCHEFTFLDHHLLGFQIAINIVKQHSDWVGVDERLPPDNMMVLVYCRIRKTTGYAFVSHQQAWSFYHFTKNSENQALAMANDISKWMSIPQPPSEVQDD